MQEVIPDTTRQSDMHPTGNTEECEEPSDEIAVGRPSFRSIVGVGWTLERFFWQLHKSLVRCLLNNLGQNCMRRCKNIWWIPCQSGLYSFHLGLTFVKKGVKWCPQKVQPSEEGDHQNNRGQDDHTGHDTHADLLQQWMFLSWDMRNSINMYILISFRICFHACQEKLSIWVRLK